MMKQHNRKIALVGLGYVGLPVAVEFGKIQEVIGFDINPTRVEELKQKIDRTNEVKAEDLSLANVVYTCDPN